MRQGQQITEKVKNAHKTPDLEHSPSGQSHWKHSKANKWTPPKGSLQARMGQESFC